MNFTLPPEAKKRVEEELAIGRYQDANRLIEDVVQYFLDRQQVGQCRLDALRRMGQAVDEAGFYERTLMSSEAQ